MLIRRRGQEARIQIRAAKRKDLFHEGLLKIVILSEIS